MAFSVILDTASSTKMEAGQQMEPTEKDGPAAGGRVLDDLGPAFVRVESLGQQARIGWRLRRYLISFVARSPARYALMQAFFAEYIAVFQARSRKTPVGIV